MVRVLNRMFWEEEGATAVEYGLLVALIGLVMAGGAVILGNGLNAMFGDIGTEVDQVAPTTVPAPTPMY